MNSPVQSTLRAHWLKIEKAYIYFLSIVFAVGSLAVIHAIRTAGEWDGYTAAAFVAGVLVPTAGRGLGYLALEVKNRV